MRHSILCAALYCSHLSIVNLFLLHRSIWASTLANSDFQDHVGHKNSMFQSGPSSFGISEKSLEDMISIALSLALGCQTIYLSSSSRISFLILSAIQRFMILTDFTTQVRKSSILSSKTALFLFSFFICLSRSSL